MVPAPEYPWELKEVLYDTPYPNPDETIPYEGFQLPGGSPGGDHAPYRKSLEDLQALFQMTPYRWKTPKAGVERLRALSQLEVRAGFRIHVFRRDMA